MCSFTAIILKPYLFLASIKDCRKIPILLCNISRLLPVTIFYYKMVKLFYSLGFTQPTYFEDLMRFANRIPTDETGEYTKEYIDMLISVGRKEDIEFLNKYLRNYNHINEFIENKQQTPQVIVDAIEKARRGILAKH